MVAIIPMFPSGTSIWRAAWSQLVLQCLLVVVTFDFICAQSTDRITLHTPEALFVGTREQLPGNRGRREFYGFYGIPYAKPPVNERRWQEAELLPVSAGTHHANAYGPKCPQMDETTQSVVGSENCLFLNVFTPQIPLHASLRDTAGTSRPLLPVVVFIHGGGFQTGSGEIVGPKRFMRHDVILVTINYRLGVLGYLSTEDEAISGNFGGLDQITALQWVQRYIRGFGGNPGRVTILGHSAGAAAVHMLMVSLKAIGLFHSAIIQSGSAFCDWAVNENPKKYAMQFGETAGCPTDDSFELAQCLSEKSIQELVEAQKMMHGDALLPLLNPLPVIDAAWKADEAFLLGHPKERMDAGAFAQVPVIAGVVSDEALSVYADIHLRGAEQFKSTDHFESTLLPDILSNLMDNSQPLGVTVDAVKAQYFEEMDVENETKKVITELVDMLGDKLFYSCHWDMMERFAMTSKSPVYSYVFSHKTPSSPSLSSSKIRRIRQMGIHHPLFNYGVGHGDELFYLFDPVKGSSERLGTEDERVSDIITRAWVSFATTGSPASGLQLIPNSVPWRPIKPGSINYYNLTSLPSPMGEDFRKGEALFWLRTIPYIQNLGNTINDLEDYPTYFWITLGIAIFLFIVTLILILVLWRRRTSGVGVIHL